MEGWTLQLNPKYTNVGKEDARRFHPYTVPSTVRENRKTIPALEIEPALNFNLLFLIFIISLVATIQAILAVGSYSGMLFVVLVTRRSIRLQTHAKEKSNVRDDR
ncbi:unnamed protein product [Haemonchus placei]|uniref:Copper transporter n=1 Tax=Haemonchus placei TaxID=6290 RepID=A0A0N4VT98_HAEPC|nr:unnamed protein product [Haemonchus placei]